MAKKKRKRKNSYDWNKGNKNIIGGVVTATIGLTGLKALNEI